MKNIDTRTVDPEPLADVNQSDQKNIPRLIEDKKLALKGGDSMSTLEEMKNIDVRTVDPDTLVDVTKIVIDEKLPKEERVAEYLRQVKNPYCFRVGNMVVKNVYSTDGVSLQERFEQFVRTL